ncbi:hypothetical protein C1645_881334 [Glomus cerebriforme]|uniref:Uncharacterized protein n=1 Tax=Glomus cerebriforme TaxID=658196 RepID=A0A397SC81_9GLOM|nr:hypothetical protein C1645_881334 [Glomus cerebriforme]
MLLLTNSQDVTNFSITDLSPKEPVGMSVTISPVYHKEETIWNDIKGEWGAGEYYGERTYRLECRDALNRGIPIVSVKA